MSLSTKLAGNFTKNVRKRGDDYYRNGRVTMHEGSQSELTACVRGSGFYEVQFAWRNNMLAVCCECPHFVEQGVPCKHVWATTLAADQHQYLTAAASADKLILDLDALGADGLDGRDYYDGNEELYEEDGTAPVLSSRSLAVVWNPEKPKPPDCAVRRAQSQCSFRVPSLRWPQFRSVSLRVRTNALSHRNIFRGLALRPL